MKIFLIIFQIAALRRTRTILFQKLPSLAPAPESENAPVLHRLTLVFVIAGSCHNGFC